MYKRRMLLLIATALLLSSQALGQAAVCSATAPQNCVFVTNFTGGEVLGVDRTTGATTVISTPSPAISGEGAVVGTDGKIYVADSDNNRIIRMNQDGTEVETVFQTPTEGTPTGPEGLSVDTQGDLVFNTRSPNHTGVWKIPGVFAVPFGGTFSAPVQIVTNAQDGSTFGEGTAFDHSDNLLFVDRSGNKVWEFITSTSTFQTTPFISANLDVPIGIGVNSAGDVFVANRGTATTSGAIQHFNSGGSFIGTFYTFASPDRPFYFRFDASDNLFVATQQETFDTSGNVILNSNGKVWRIDTSGNATLLTTLTCSLEGCTPPPAVGIALPPTNPAPITQPLFSAGGTATFSYANNAYNIVYQYPAGFAADGDTLTVTAMETSQADWAARTPTGNPYNGTLIVPVAGTGGYGIIYEAVCTTASGGACPLSTLTYTTTTSWNSLTTANSSPGFLKAPIGTNSWENTLVSYSPTRTDLPDPTGVGKSCCGFSDWAFVSGVTGTAPTITITTPANNAVYLLNQAVAANFTCTGSSVAECDGTVPNGSNIDTSSVGTKTFEVTAVVSSGPSADTSVSYQVAYNTSGSCLLYNPAMAKLAGSTYPIKLELCDANGNDLSSASITVHAVSVTMAITGTPGPLNASGNANPGNNFRFDSTLGTAGGYIFNLSTVGLSSGTWNLNFMAGADPTTHSAQFKVQ